MKKFRTQKHGTAIWKILEHRDLHSCPECKSEGSLHYLGFVETYSLGLHGKMFQCNICETWVDMVWSKRLGRHQDNEPAGV